MYLNGQPILLQFLLLLTLRPQTIHCPFNQDLLMLQLLRTSLILQVVLVLVVEQNVLHPLLMLLRHRLCSHQLRIIVTIIIRRANGPSES